ncbi:MAG: MarR family winged helix-turn-helix transcriptional regulator [Frankiaceae bacterium]
MVTSPEREPLTPEEEAAWRTFRRVTVQLPRKLEADLQSEQRMSNAAYGALVNLSEAPGRAGRMSWLADEIGLTRSAITRLIDKLERDGLVERLSCVSDARGSYARLTEAGMEALRKAYPTHLASVRRHLFDRLPPEMVEALGIVAEALVDKGYAPRVPREGDFVPASDLAARAGRTDRLAERRKSAAAQDRKRKPA